MHHFIAKPSLEEVKLYMSYNTVIKAGLSALSTVQGVCIYHSSADKLVVMIRLDVRVSWYVGQANPFYNNWNDVRL